MCLSQKQKKQINVFKQLLAKQNQNLNLFSRKNPESQLKFLFNQGLTTGKMLNPIIVPDTGPFLDIGSGNGFPGLLLSILYPESCFYLCERSQKKCEFLKYVLIRAEIHNAKVLGQRVEDINRSFQVIFSQAALPIKKLLRLLKKILAQRGKAFLWKSALWEKDWPEENHFTARIFKTYKLNNRERVLLEIKKA